MQTAFKIIKENKKILIIILGVISLIAILVLVYFTFFKNNQSGPTAVNTQKPTSRIVTEETERFVISNSQITPPESAEIYAYVTNAYYDCISTKKIPDQTCASMSLSLINYIFVNQDVVLLDKKKFEDFTSTQSGYEDALNVRAKYTDRIDKDLKYYEIYSGNIPTGADKWVSPTNKPPFAVNAGSWTRWNYDNSFEYQVPPPLDYNSAAFENEKNIVKGAVEKRTASWVVDINYWGGVPGTEQPAGIWQNELYSVDKAKEMFDIEYAKTQSLLASSIADSFMEVWKVKYKYWTARPSQVIDNLNIAMPNPNFPSYVSGHSTISATAATILSKLIPSYADKWMNGALTAKNTRLYAGIHFPMDNEVGFQLGENIGRKILGEELKNIVYPLPTEETSSSSSEDPSTKIKFNATQDLAYIKDSTFETPNNPNTSNSTLFILKKKYSDVQFPFIKINGNETPVVSDPDYEIVSANKGSFWSPEVCAGKPTLFLGNFIVSDEGIGNKTFVGQKKYYNTFSVYDIARNTFRYVEIPTQSNLYTFGFSYVDKDQFRVISAASNSYVETIVDLGNEKIQDRKLYDISDEIWNSKDVIQSNTVYENTNNTSEYILIDYSNIPQSVSVKYSRTNLNFDNPKISYYHVNGDNIQKVTNMQLVQTLLATFDNQSYTIDGNKLKYDNNEKTFDVVANQSNGSLFDVISYDVFIKTYSSGDYLKYGSNLVRYNLQTLKFSRLLKDNGSYYRFFSKIDPSA